MRSDLSWESAVTSITFPVASPPPILLRSSDGLVGVVDRTSPFRQSASLFREPKPRGQRWVPHFAAVPRRAGNLETEKEFRTFL
ncbi:hypothetical protein B296_00059134 [Ensete ventricosum]|uniref:Uncharacterized protein n=1 Tax=Ensete ventricosum TaxID=4639 RepID=A0A426XJ20_ENSVE|nr:hypothetical protein B296_00059134 [Ensete ventricosum]